jgi:predicted ATP-dependent endonuclease of OLD family
MQPSQNELFFSQIPILVEGPEDIAFISSHLHLSGRWTDFRRLGCHFVRCDGKTNLSRPLAIAECLGIKAFVIFDGDCDETEPNKRTRNERDNKCIIKICCLNLDPLPKISYFDKRLVMWQTRIHNIIRADIGSEKWDEAEAVARKQHDLVDGVRQKNPMVISATIETLWNQGTKSAIMDNVCNRIIEHARSYENQ